MNLKRIYPTFVLSSLIFFGLSACTNVDTEVSKLEEKTKEIDNVVDVLTLASDATENVKNYNIEMSLTQNMNLMGSDFSTSMNSNGHINLEPLIIHQTTLMETDELKGEDKNNRSLETEMYSNEDEIYIKDSATKNWSHSKGKDIRSLSSVQSVRDYGPDRRMEMLEKIASDAVLTENKELYVVTMENTDAQGAKDIILENFDATFGEGEELKQAIGETIEIIDMKIEATFDKKTFLPLTAHIHLNLTFVVEGNTVNLKQNIDTAYSDFDKVENIKIPADVKNTAVEVEK